MFYARCDDCGHDTHCVEIYASGYDFAICVDKEACMDNINADNEALHRLYVLDWRRSAAERFDRAIELRGTTEES